MKSVQCGFESHRPIETVGSGVLDTKSSRLLLSKAVEPLSRLVTARNLSSRGFILLDHVSGLRFTIVVTPVTHHSSFGMSRLHYFRQKFAHDSLRLPAMTLSSPLFAESPRGLLLVTCHQERARADTLRPPLSLRGQQPLAKSFENAAHLREHEMQPVTGTL